MTISQEEVYNMICKFAYTQLSKSSLIGAYDWKDIAHDTFVRYLKGDWDFKSPSSYLWLAVSSTIKNQYRKDLIRGYKENQPVKSGYNSDEGWVSEIEEGHLYSEEFIDPGPENKVFCRQIINKLQSRSKYQKFLKEAVLYDLGRGDSRRGVCRESKIPVKKMYAEIDSYKKLAVRYGYEI